MKAPDFMIAGVMKSGSTSVYHYLSQHPEIFMCPEKEPDFFNYNYQKGYGWYESLFKEASAKQLTGEASVRMFNMKDPLNSLKNNRPHIKLIFILRNPVERLYSNYMYDLSKGYVRPSEEFSKIIRNPNWRWYQGYVDLGYYTKHLDYIRSIFPAENTLVLFYDDLKSDPLSLCKNIFQFLGVDNTFKPTVNKSYNPTIYPKDIKKYQKIYGIWDPIRDRIKKSKASFLLSNSTLKIRGLIRNNLLYTNTDNSKMDPQDRKYLVDLYRESVHELQLAEKRDLSNWLI